MKQGTVFVYGTLRKKGSNHQLIAGKFQNVEKGWITGALYDLPYGYPAVVVENDPGTVHGKVYGEIYTFSNLQKILPQLDALEGYYGPNHPNEYERILLPVMRETGGLIKCFVYVQSVQQIRELKGKAVRILSGDWVKDRIYK